MHVNKTGIFRKGSGTEISGLENEIIRNKHDIKTGFLFARIAALKSDIQIFPEFNITI